MTVPGSQSPTESWFPEAPPEPGPQRSGKINQGEWTVAPEDAAGPNGYLYGVPIARAPRRVGAFFIDLGATVFLPSLVLDATGSSDLGLVVVLAVIVNTFVRPFHGVSLGKRLMSIQDVYPVYFNNGAKTMARPSAYRTALRLVLHCVVDALFCIGLIFAFANHRYQRTSGDAFAKVIHVDTRATGPDSKLKRAPMGALPIT